MKHITYSDKNFLVGDDVAQALTLYTAALGNAHAADTVTINAVGADGDPVEATFVLNEGTVLASESSTATFEEPNNWDAVTYMTGRTALLNDRSEVVPSEFEPHEDDFADL